MLFLIKKNASNEIEKICLAMKKRGFGVGRWNGAGGKVLNEETVEQALMRETNEELRVLLKDYYQVGDLNFLFPHNEDWNQNVLVYFSESWNGEPVETEEMKPRWFSVREIPYNQMWSDDILWLPKVLSGEFVNAEFEFGPNDEVLSYKFIRS